MSIHYTPKPGSVADQVIAFFEENPDEELTRADIAQKFDTAHATVDSTLQLAVARGCLVRERNRSMEMVWKLGRVKAQRDLSRAAEAPIPATVPRTSPFAASALDFDPLSIKVRKGVRLKTAAQRLEEKFDQLFESFEVGDSAEFDDHLASMLRLQSRRFSKGRAVKFVFMDTEPGKVGMERRA